MTDWWSYAPADFLMFSPRTYYRLFELYNARLWPAQWLALALGLAAIVLLWRRRAAVLAPALGVLGLLWIGVGVGYHAGQLAAVHTAAHWFAAAFVAQGLLLAGWAVLLMRRGPAATPPMQRRATVVGTALLVVAVVVMPLAAVALGRPWTQAEVAGIAPDPTVVATFALLAMMPASRRAPGWRILPWIVPLAWAAAGAMTLATMGAPEAALMPMAAVLALIARWRSRSLHGG